MNRVHWLAALPWAGLLVAAACSSNNSSPNTVVGSSGLAASGTQEESSGSAAQSGAGAPSGQGSGASAGAASGSSGAVAGSGTVPSSGMGGSGVGGSGTGSSGSPDSGVGASGTMLDSGPAGDGAASVSSFPHGGSTGCGQAPNGATSTGTTNTKIMIPTCGGALTYPDCIDPHFAPGFTPASASSYATSNGEDYNNREYNIQLPSNYNPNTPYPIFFGGAGCGSGGNGYGVNDNGAIHVNLAIMNDCFADGGTSCAGSVANEPNCKMGPELPYFRAVLAQVESKFCVDRARVFIGGYSSGAWEANTLGCGAANQIRGTVTLEGGWRNDQPACTGPVAALMVVGGVDGTNPIGPLVENTPYPAGGLTADQVNSLISDLDSNGSAPARDAVLQRNQCVGTATAQYDPKYPDCVKYTGCPAEYPVVWCEIPNCAHICSTDNGVNYSPGSVQGDPLMWNFLSNLPAVN